MFSITAAAAALLCSYFYLTEFNNKNLIQFQHPEYLFALAALPVLGMSFLWLQQWKKKTTKKIGDPVLVAQLIEGYSASRHLFKFLLIVLAYASGVIALANPRSPNGNNSINRSGIDVMIALDVSKSMLAQDIKPDRLNRAKQFIAKLIDKLNDDRVGIVVFAGKAYLQMPLTTDHAAAKMYLSSASTDVVPTQGTVIGDALKMCYNAFNNKEKKYKSVVLISDGEDHDEGALKIAKAMADDGVMINTVGIGSAEGAMIMDAATNEIKKDAAGAPVITKLNESELKNIAASGNGIYALLSGTDEAAAKVQAQLNSIGRHSITENSALVYQNFFQWFAAMAVLLLVIELLLAERRRSTNGNEEPKLKKVKKSAVAAACLFLSLGTVAQNTEQLLKKGNEAYQKKEYSAAEAEYKKAAVKNPDNSKAIFNLGNALYKNNKAEEATQAYDAAIIKDRQPVDKGAAFYNKGVVLQNSKKIPECIDAYKNALRLNPGDEDARLNLQKALQQQKKEQQNNQEKQKQQQKPNDQKNQQPKPQPSKMTRKEAEEKLKALMQQEKNLQDKLRKVDAASPEKPEKDW